MTTEIMRQRARVSSGPAAIGGLLALLLLLILIGDDRRLPGEVRLQDEISVRVTPRAWAAGACEFFIGAGAIPIVLLTVGCATWLVWRRFGTQTAALVPAASLAAVVAELLSDVLDEPLPSGHMTYAAAEFGMLAVLAERAGRRDVVAMLLVVIAGMAFSLFARGRHHIGSILAGGALGFAWVLGLLIVDARERSA